MRQIKSILLISILLGIVYNSFAQLYVDPEGNIGVGVENSPTARMKILNETEGIGLIVENGGTNDQIGIGIQNILTVKGRGSRYGIRSTIYQDESDVQSPAQIFGHMAFVFPYGIGQTTGLYSLIKGEGKCTRIGVFADVTSPVGNTRGSTTGIFANINALSGTTNVTYGIRTTTINEGNGESYGVHNRMLSINGTNDVYANFNTVLGQTTGTKYGVYSIVTAGEGYAGYFVGDVQIKGDLIRSQGFRTEDNTERIIDALNIVNQLEPKLNKQKGINKLTGKPNHNKYGFVAQQVEQVIPTIVKSIKQPAVYEPIDPEEEGTDNARVKKLIQAEETYQSIDYDALIPILTQAIKDQQAQIEKLNKRLHQLEQE